MKVQESISIIGGADGPTSVFLAGRLDWNWLNVFGLIIMILILIPNIIYAIKEKNHENKCTNMFMNAMEQIGRYGCMLLMVVNIGIDEMGFRSIGAFLFYLFGNVLLIVCYWVIWMLYFIKPTYCKQMLLALIPVSIFLLSGITMLYWLLIICAIVFGIGHVYVVKKNNEKEILESR